MLDSNLEVLIMLVLTDGIIEFPQIVMIDPRVNCIKLHRRLADI